MAVRKRRRKRRGRIAGVAIMFLFLLAVIYIAFIAITQPDRIMAGLFKKQNAAPALAQAADQNSLSDDVSQTDAADSNSPLETDSTDSTESSAANPYSQFNFYIADNLNEYLSYQTEHPTLDAEDVTWMVNAGLNRPFFTEAVVNTDANPLLVNPYNRLPDDFVPVALENIDDNGRLATPETIEAFRQMREGAIGSGFDLTVQSAYRTVAYQQGLYDRESGDGSVARPTFSEHHTGRALDLWGPDGLLDERTPSETGKWVKQHAYEYGFIVRYTVENESITGYISEPWHITYVGDAIARDMHEGGYGSLEEYVAKNPQAKLP